MSPRTARGLALIASVVTLPAHARDRRPAHGGRRPVGHLARAALALRGRRHRPSRSCCSPRSSASRSWSTPADASPVDPAAPSAEGGNSAATYYGCLLLVEFGALATFFARDAILFFVAFEVVLVPMWVLISRFGDDHATERARADASNRFVLYTALGSTLMLVGILVLVVQSGTSDLGLLAAAHGAGLSAADPGARRDPPRRRPRHQGAACGRSTPGSRRPTPSPRRPGRCSWPPCC